MTAWFFMRTNLKVLHVGQELSRGELVVLVVELGHVVEILARQRPPPEGNAAGHLPVRRSPTQRVE